jgi:YDG domain
MKNNYLTSLKFSFKYLKFASLFILMLCINRNGFSQTTLAVGDISIIGFNSNAPDNFAFVCWVDIAPNTKIKFTDNGFLSSNSSTSTNNGRGGENFAIWTNTTTNTIPAGTVIKIEDGTPANVTLGSVVLTLSGISSSGDQIFAYQGSGAGTSNTTSDFGTNTNPSTFTGSILFGLNFATAWITTGTATSNTSYLPSDLNIANGNVVISTSSTTRGQYTGSRTNQVTLSAYRALVNNVTNWTTATGTGVISLNTSSFTIPTISSTGTLNSVNTTYGTPSTTPTTFTVSGSNLTNDILVTPPSGYEISKIVGGASGYAASQTLTQASGSVTSTIIYVRLSANTAVSGSPYTENIVLSSAGATNVNVPTVSSSVAAKTLTISGITADNKVYDATTTASLTGTPAYVGLENVETFSVSGTPIATFPTASIGTAKTVSVSGYTAPSSNYTLTQPTLTAKITPALLTITSPIASNKIYDGNNSATITGTLSGIIGSEIVTLNSSGTFSQTDIGTVLSVTSTSTITGVDTGNYSLTQPTGLTGDITTKPLTITGITANNKVFDGNTTATLSGNATLNGIVGTDNVSLTGTPIATFASSTVGNGIVVTVTGYLLTGSLSGNYTVSQPNGLTADITNLPTPSINSSLTSSATYGVASTSYFITATNSPTSYNATNLPTGLSINTSSGEISGTPTDVVGSPFNVTISATNNGGTGMATLVYTVSPKTLTVSSPSVPNKVYDRVNAATISGTLTGIIGTDVVSLNGTGTFSQSTVGTALSVISTSTLTGADASKYSLTQPTGLTGEIVVKPLTVSGATASNKVYDGTSTATLTGVMLNGIISPDDVTITRGPIFSSTDVANNISINTSSLVLGGADAINYIALPIVGLTANITPKSLIISGLSVSDKVYDGNISATLTGTALLNGIIGTDDVSLSGTTITNFNDKNIGTGKPITVSGYTLTGTKSGNYTVAQPTGLTANITAKSLTITSPIAQTKVFDGNTNAVITGTLTGVISPDVVTLVGTGTFASSAIGNGIAVTSTSTLSGADAGNYTLTQPIGLTADITGLPTIMIDVATTSNYIDGGLLTSPTSPYSLSAVMNDPTDPAKTLGIGFTINDASVPVGNLIVTAISSNTSVVPNANLVLIGAGASRNLKITPVGEGFATISVTVNNGGSTTSFTINYASSNASANTTTTRFHTGTSDASTTQMIDTNLMIVADDENQALRMYDRNNSGLPINSFNFTTSLGLTDISGGNPREVDIEASAKVGNRIYWMGSHSNASSGNNRPNRSRFFATDVSGTGNNTTLSYIGRYDNLKTELLTWDANNGHGLGANFLGLSASSATGKAPETADGSGFNIEGFEIAPNNSTAYICFRAPVENPTTRTKALIIPLTNFTSLVNGNPTSTTATFGNPIQLDLGGRAIREMKKNASGEYLIIAGPHDGSTGIAPKDFRFYTWTGNPNDAPILRSANLTALNSGGSFESIVDLPSPLVATSNLQVLVDNGDAVFYGNGVIAKDLPQNNHKKFRSETINLGTEILPLVTIKSITTGNWESTSTWDLGRMPQSGDLVIIDQNHEVTLNGNGNIKKIEYQGTGKIKFNSAASILNTGL